LGFSGPGVVEFLECNSVHIHNSATENLILDGSHLAFLGNGHSGGKLTMFGGSASRENAIENSPPFFGVPVNTTKFSHSSDGILVLNSNLSIASCDVSGCGANGVSVVRNSHLRMPGPGVLSGAGNSGLGVYMDTNSSVGMDSGAVPTITGTAGDIGIKGVAPVGWGTIVPAGTPYSDSVQHCIAQEN